MWRTKKMKTADDYTRLIQRGEELEIQTVGELRAYLDACNELHLLSDEEPIQLEIQVGDTTYCGHTDFDVKDDSLPPHLSGNVYKKNAIKPITILQGVVFQIKHTGTVVGR